jgi:3-carboxy-cis,cis-muconate cycloisomerase
MTDLLWPGAHRAGDIFTDASVVAAMVRVEAAWAGEDLDGLIGPDDLDQLARDAEDGGNPVIPLLRLLRSRARSTAVLHAGLTSQDVLDTALALCLRDAVDRIRAEISGQVAALRRLADEHRHTEMAGRTLTQHAIPITFGLKVAGWLNGVLDARDGLADAALPAQFGGAAGSLAAPVALTGSPEKARAHVTAVSLALGLPVRDPWHTSRLPVARAGDALTGCTDAWGRIANDVLLGARPEVGELAEGTAEGRGGSSAMPNKQNPVLSVLLRRAALAAPPLAATLHLAAAEAVDERPDGSWHLEWDTLRTLSRRTVTAASHAAELLSGLKVTRDRMAATLAAARPGIDAEQHKYAVDGPYLGATDHIIDAAIARAKEQAC